jgi:hypothetical protein
MGHPPNVSDNSETKLAEERDKPAAAAIRLDVLAGAIGAGGSRRAMVRRGIECCGCKALVSDTRLVNVKGYSGAMENGERRWIELCAQASATKDPRERARIVRELAELLIEMQKSIKDLEDRESIKKLEDKS